MASFFIVYQNLRALWYIKIGCSGSLKVQKKCYTKKMYLLNKFTFYYGIIFILLQPSYYLCWSIKISLLFFTIFSILRFVFRYDLTSYVEKCLLNAEFSCGVCLPICGMPFCLLFYKKSSHWEAKFQYTQILYTSTCIHMQEESLILRVQTKISLYIYTYRVIVNLHN